MRRAKLLLQPGVWLCLVILAFGCRARPKHPPYAMTPAAPRQTPAKLTVATNRLGPIKYQWAQTNGPDGTRVYRFTPGP